MKRARLDVHHNSANVETMMPSLPTGPIDNPVKTCTWVDPALYQPRLTHVPLPYLSGKIAALGLYQPKAKYSHAGAALGSNQPELTLKANLSPEGEKLGAYQPEANSSQRGPVCGINQPEITPKGNLSPEGETLEAYQPTANSNQRGPVCGINQPELIPKANLSPEGETLGAYQPKANSSQKGSSLGDKSARTNP